MDRYIPGVLEFPNQIIEIKEDFIASSAVGNNGWTVFTSGVLASADSFATNLDTTHWGAMRLDTGTTAAGIANISLDTDTILLGSGVTIFKAAVYIPTLSTAAQEFNFRIGLGNVNLGAFTNGIFFQYLRTSSVNWRCLTTKAGTSTTTTTTTAVAAGAWIRLMWVLNDATSVEFFINEVSVGTNSTNIPTANVGPNIQLTKTAGLTSRVVDTDYFYLKCNLGAAR